MAVDAGVKRLVLTHYPQDATSRDLQDGAKTIYKGDISLPTINGDHRRLMSSWLLRGEAKNWMSELIGARPRETIGRA